MSSMISAAQQAVSGAVTAAPQAPRVVLPHAAQLPVLSRQHARLQGLTLSQIDASVFAALPAEHQQELLQALPMTTHRPPDTPPAGDTRQIGASDFAFVTKLANLQRGGLARTSVAVDPGGSRPTVRKPPASPERIWAPAESTDTPPDRYGAEAVHSGLTESSLHPLKQAVRGDVDCPPSDAVHSAPGQDTAARDAKDAKAGVSIGSPIVARDPAFVSQLSAGTHGADLHASSSPLDKANCMLDVGITSAYNRDDNSLRDMSAHQAQQAPQSDPTSHPHDAAGEDEAPYLDQALDMDLVEEEWVAMAAQGQLEEHNRQPLAQAPNLGPAPHHAHQFLAQHGAEAALSGPLEEQAGPLHVPTAAAGPAQQQGQGSKAAGVHPKPVSALPPASQIDSSVLDALPLQVRRELELAYGIVLVLCCCAYPTKGAAGESPPYISSSSPLPILSSRSINWDTVH